MAGFMLAILSLQMANIIFFVDTSQPKMGLLSPSYSNDEEFMDFAAEHQDSA